MLLVEEIGKDIIRVRNTFTGTPMTLPVHWLEVNQDIKEGDVIKIIKDEVNTKRYQKGVDNGSYSKNR